MLKVRSSTAVLYGMVALLTGAATRVLAAEPSQPAAKQELVIIDTDIGDDIDDAFAVGLALSSPEVKILGITSAWGDTALRSRLLDRLLCETGRADIPVATGIEKYNKRGAILSQARWAEREPARPHPDAVDFILSQIKLHPGQITLIGIAPLTNVAAALDRDAQTFRRLKRIVIMGGSVRQGYGDLGYKPDKGPSAEYNIAMDVEAAKKVFTAGVPLYVMPLDSTQIKLGADTRGMLFAQGTALTDALALLYDEWSGGDAAQTPTLFDPVAVAYSIDPQLCPATPMRLRVDDAGYTREEPGAPNVQVCLHSDSDVFLHFFMPRLLEQKMEGVCPKGVGGRGAGLQPSSRP